MDAQRQRQIERLRARAAEVERARRAIDRARSQPLRSGSTRRGQLVRAAEVDAVRAFWAAVRAAYPDGFWQTIGPRYEHLAAGDAAAVELAVVFLEADPWFFRSGYVKADLIRRLQRLTLTPKLIDRLSAVVLAVVDGRDRREFRWYARLARRIDNSQLREALLERHKVTDPGVRRRAGWVLDALGVPIS